MVILMLKLCDAGVYVTKVNTNCVMLVFTLQRSTQIVELGLPVLLLEGIFHATLNAMLMQDDPYI